MRNSHFIRRMDSMGRIVIPKDLRRELNIIEDDNISLFLNDNHIELRKYDYSDKLDIIKKLKERVEYYSLEQEQICIQDEVIEGFLSLIPLVNNSDVIGLLIIIGDSLISSFDKLYINMIKRFVENQNIL